MNSRKVSGNVVIPGTVRFEKLETELGGADCRRCRRKQDLQLISSTERKGSN